MRKAGPASHEPSNLQGDHAAVTKYLLAVSRFTRANFALCAGEDGGRAAEIYRTREVQIHEQRKKRRAEMSPGYYDAKKTNK